MTTLNPASAAAVALVAVLAATPGPAAAQFETTRAIVDTMRKLAGDQKARPSGAKGQCFTGSFTPSAEAGRLSKSVIFTKPSRVVARFSVGGGNPRVMDANKAVNRGFSFRIDDGGPGQTEFVMINAPINFVKSPEQMLGFLQARVPGADGKPDAEKIKAFAEANPETTNQGKFLASRPVAASWVGVTYWGVHNYTLTNAAGQRQLVKFRMEPIGGEVGLTDDEAKAKPADFLVDEMKARLEAKRPAGFNMVAMIGRAGDEKTNATEMWADEDARPRVVLGQLTMAAIETNETCDQGIFDPVTLADGIAGPENDPLFLQRQIAYAMSITERR